MQKASGRSICTEHGRKKGRGGFLQNPWQELPTYSTSFHSHKNINRISIDVVTRTQGGRAGIPASCLVYFILRMEIPRGEELCLAITLLACSPICLSKPRQTLSAGCMDERIGRRKEEEPRGPSNAPVKSLKHRPCAQWGQGIGRWVTGYKPSPQESCGFGHKKLSSRRKEINQALEWERWWQPCKEWAYIPGSIR